MLSRGRGGGWHFGEFGGLGNIGQWASGPLAYWASGPMGHCLDGQANTAWLDTLKGGYQILNQTTLYPQPRKLMDNHQLSLICMWTCSQPLGARGGMIWGKYISNHASPGATTCNKSVFRKWPKCCKLTWKCQFVFADPLFFLHNIKTYMGKRGGVNHLGSDTEGCLKRKMVGAMRYF